jgi:hypothetical protein
MSQVLEGGCVLVEFPRKKPEEPKAAKKRKAPKGWRRMSAVECALALCFQDIPELVDASPFARAMISRANRGMPITEKQGDAIHAVACSWAAHIPDEKVNALVAEFCSLAL